MPTIEPCSFCTPRQSERTTLSRIKATEKMINHQKMNKDLEASATGTKAKVKAFEALTSKTQTPRKTLPFPPEIRLKFFANIFDQPYKIIWRPSESIIYPDDLNILQVSSTVYQEAYEALCETATFKFDIGDMLRYDGWPRTVYETTMTMAPRIRHASVIFWYFSWHWTQKLPPSQRAIKSTTELLRTISRNTWLRSLELVMNEDGPERLAIVQTLQFLKLAIPLMNHAEGRSSYVSSYMLLRSDELNAIRVGFDQHWRILLLRFEAIHGPQVATFTQALYGSHDPAQEGFRSRRAYNRYRERMPGGSEEMKVSLLACR